MHVEPISAVFVLMATAHGSMIVNRLDANRKEPEGYYYGVGYDLMTAGMASISDLELLSNLLDQRRKHFGERVMVLDCGANIGTHVLSLAKSMYSWGNIIAIEAQERLFYALAGNIALNNCFNARAIFAAVGAELGAINVPHLDFHAPGSFGSLELRPHAKSESIGQPIDYQHSQSVPMLTIDSLNLPRVDLIKLDIEGMEMEALYGAEATIQRCKPILYIEFLKIDRPAMFDFLHKHGYSHGRVDINCLAVHRTDPCRGIVEEAVAGRLHDDPRTADG